MKQKTKATKATAPVPLGNNTGQQVAPNPGNRPDPSPLPGTGPQNAPPVPEWWGDLSKYNAWWSKRQREITELKLRLTKLEE